MVITYLTNRWGIFEYHPDPFNEQDLAFYTHAIELLYQYRAHIILPLDLYAFGDGSYQLLGSSFEVAFRNFFSANWPGTSHRRFDQPYFNQEWIDYLAPAVTGIQFQDDTLSWSNSLWPQRPDLTWKVWGEFDRFDIYQDENPDFIPNPSNRIGTKTGYSFSGLTPGNYKVLAISKTGLSSPVD